MQQPKAQTFNDGLCTIYRVDNIAAAGNMPKDGLVVKTGPLRFDERVVGIGRFYSAMQAMVKIDRLIRVQRDTAVTADDVAVLHDGKQYRVKQVQYPPDIELPVMDLSLERLEPGYEIA